METKVSSPTKEVIIGDAQPTVIIGERINPAGKTKLQEALKAGNLDIVRSEALSQAQAGADILDVNVSAFGVDEAALLPQAVQVVMDVVDLPLCLDSAKPEALAAALVSADDRSVEMVVIQDEAPQLRLDMLGQMVQNLLNGHPAITPGIFVKDLQTGEELEINGDVAYAGIREHLCGVSDIVQTHGRGGGLGGCCVDRAKAHIGGVLLAGGLQLCDAVSAFADD